MSYDHSLCAICCCHHFSRPLAGRRRRASPRAGSSRGGSTGSRAASPSRCRSRACSSSCRSSSVSRRRRRRRAGRSFRQLVPAGGIVQNGFGQAGVRSVWYAITKPRTPYSEPAAPTTRRWLRADRRARLGVAVARRRARARPSRSGRAAQLARRRVERGDRHVERQDEHLPVAERDAAVGDDPEVAEDGDVVGLPAPDDRAGRRVEREDVVVVRRHVERAVDSTG